MASPLFYDGVVRDGAHRVNVPVLAVHSGETPPPPWQSGKFQSLVDFKTTLGRVNPQVRVFLAIPQLHAMNFVRGRTLDQIHLEGRVAPNNVTNSADVLRMALPIPATFVMRSPKVEETRAIDQNRLPAWPYLQELRLSKLVSANTNRLLIVVKLFVPDSEVA
jgi:hypothetical protein